MKQQKILVVDDDASILDVLAYNLKSEGYRVKTVQNGQACLDVIGNFHPDLIVIDIMMPKLDGIETCRQIRKKADMQELIILFLTARDEEYSEVAAFESGADDFLIKPVKIRAFLKRVEKLLSRQKVLPKDSKILVFDNLKINKTSYEVFLHDKKLTFPRKEFEILHLLAKSPNRVFNRDEILLKIWGSDVYILNRTVDVHIRKIREQLGNGFIETIKGIGYKFNHQQN